MRYEDTSTELEVEVVDSNLQSNSVILHMQRGNQVIGILHASIIDHSFPPAFAGSLRIVLPWRWQESRPVSLFLNIVGNTITYSAASK